MCGCIVTGSSSILSIFKGCMVLNFSAMLMEIKLILVFILDLFTCGVSWVSFKVL